MTHEELTKKYMEALQQIVELQKEIDSWKKKNDALVQGIKTIEAMLTKQPRVRNDPECFLWPGVF